MIEKIREHWMIAFLAVLFVSIQCISLFSSADLWWDASVYIGMGKYIYSLGHAGLWESERPLVWPLMLGFFWKIGMNEILWGKILTIFFSTGCIILIYALGLRYCNKTTAIISSLFLGFAPIFFLYTGVLHTEIPAAFFLLLGIYYYEKHQFLAGLLFGISMMTRFFQIIVIIPILLYIIMRKRQEFFHYIGGFGIPLLLFFSVNWFLYHNPVQPFILQAYMTQNTGWIFHQPWGYYFIEIFKENIFFIGALAGIYAIFKEKNSEKLLIAAVFILGFIPFIFEAHKEMRLLISLLPFLALLTAYGIYSLLETVHRKKIVYILLIIFWIGYTIPQLQFNTYDDHLDFFYAAVADAPQEGLWISNPSMIAYTDRTAGLIYFPLYNTEKIHELEQKMIDAQMILLNSCDILPCPSADISCNAAHAAFIELLQQHFETTTGSYGECSYYLFKQ